MLSSRSLLAGVLALGFTAVAPGVAFGDGQPVPEPSASPTSRDGGVIDGEITNVDFQRGIITINSPTRGKIDVRVMPSTAIQGPGEGYHGISDLGRGVHVHVFTSQSGNAYTAQIITLP